MKIGDITGFNNAKSLLSSDPFGFDVLVRGGEYQAFDKKSDSETPVAKLIVDSGVITSLEIDEEADVGGVITALLKKLCDDADDVNTMLIVHPESLAGGTRAIRFLESFGFMRGKDDFLIRRPGAALPYSVMW